jgi:acyl-CoA synthetase (AMP-forming)/AMP-acid ligase II
MSGYLGRPEETRSAFRDGWYRTGDLGQIDNESYLFISGRAKDMIVSGGLNVYPAEVEAALSTHEAVREVAVVGSPDSRWGEAVTAVVVSNTEDKPLCSELIEHCRGQLASYKKPVHIVFVDSLPRNSAGKVVKGSVREIASALLAQDS